MATIRIFDSFGAVFPYFCPDKREIWHGGADRSTVPNFTFIGATCRSCGAKKNIFGPLSKNNTGIAPGLPVTIINRKKTLECLSARIQRHLMI